MKRKLWIGVVGGTAASAAGSVNTNVNGLYGSITIAADGTYTYVVDNNNATVQGLRNSANTLVDVFTYSMTDAAGLSSTQQISVTIQGSNDTPTAVADNAIAVEAGGVANATPGSNGSGNVLSNDTDVDSAAFERRNEDVNGIVAGVAGTASGTLAAQWRATTAPSLWPQTAAIPTSWIIPAQPYRRWPTALRR